MAGEPKLLPSTANWTVPPLSKVPEPGVTVAVKVTVWPNVEGFSDELTAVVVVALLTAWPPLRVPLLLLKVGVAAIGGRDGMRADSSGPSR